MRKQEFLRYFDRCLFSKKSRKKSLFVVGEQAIRTIALCFGVSHNLRRIGRGEDPICSENFFRQWINWAIEYAESHDGLHMECEKTAKGHYRLQTLRIWRKDADLPDGFLEFACGSTKHQFVHWLSHRKCPAANYEAWIQKQWLLFLKKHNPNRLRAGQKPVPQVPLSQREMELIVALMRKHPVFVVESKTGRGNSLEKTLRITKKNASKTTHPEPDPTPEPAMETPQQNPAIFAPIVYKKPLRGFKSTTGGRAEAPSDGWQPPAASPRRLSAEARGEFFGKKCNPKPKPWLVGHPKLKKMAWWLAKQILKGNYDNAKTAGFTPERLQPTILALLEAGISKDAILAAARKQLQAEHMAATDYQLRHGLQPDPTFWAPTGFCSRLLAHFGVRNPGSRPSKFQSRSNFRPKAQDNARTPNRSANPSAKRANGETRMALASVRGNLPLPPPQPQQVAVPAEENIPMADFESAMAEFRKSLRR